MTTRLKTVLASVFLALGLAVAGPAAEAGAKTKAPSLTAIRCVPKTLAACKSGVKLMSGQRLQLSGKSFKRGMRVSFRWSRGALATKLTLDGVGWTARVPAGTALGTVAVTVTDKAGRRSNKRNITVVGQPVVSKPKVSQTTGLPAAFEGNGMWIWYVNKSEGGDLDAIAARAKAAGMTTVFVKSADAANAWTQFTPALIAGLHQRGLSVCGWQFVYGNNPTGEAAAAAASVAAGADCFVIDAESDYEGKYKSAQTYMTALRAAVGPTYPIGLTSFPYVDYHPKLPFSVFLGPGGAQANLPQVYWKDIGGSVDAVSAKTYANNRIYGTQIAPLGQTYNGATGADLRRFRALWAGYGSKGLSWWDWQETSNAQWSVLNEAAANVAPADPGWPALDKGASGDQVIWLEQHLETFDPTVKVDGKVSAADVTAIKTFQTSKGLPPTGETDAATWQALLALAPQPVDWS